MLEFIIALFVFLWMLDVLILLKKSNKLKKEIINLMKGYNGDL